MLANWAIVSEQGAPAGSGQSGVASNAGTMIVDMSGMQVVLGDNANPLPTAADFARCLHNMAEDKKIVSFFAQDVKVRNAERLMGEAKNKLLEPTQMTSALTIPTPIRPAIPA